MNPKKALESLLGTEEMETPLTLLLAGKAGKHGERHFWHGNIDSSLDREIRKLALRRFRELREEHGATGTTPVRFDPGNPTAGRHEIAYIPVEEDDHIKAALGKIPTAPEDLTEYDGKVARKHAPNFYVVETRLPSGTRLRLFRKIPPQVAVGEEQLLIRMVGNRLTPLKGVRFVLDAHFSCIQVDNCLFIFSPKAFESIFDYREALEKRGEAVIETLGTMPLISTESFPSFIKAMRGSKFALRRAQTISQVLATGSVTIEKLQTDCADFGIEHIVFQGEGVNRRIAFDGHIRNVIKLLSEDYYRGRLTNRPYVAGSKRLVSDTT